MLINLVFKWVLRLLLSLPIYIDMVRHDHAIAGSKIFAVNHPSTLDPIMVMVALREEVCMLISQNVFGIPLIGFILKVTGNIPVIDGQGRKTFNAALTKLRMGKNILIFPEGKLSEEDGSIGHPYSGAVRLAIEAQVPVIPVGISFVKNKAYQKKIHINNKYEYMRFFFFGRYNITAGKPLYFSGKSNDAEMILREKGRLMREISHLSEESAMRLYSK